MYSIPLYHVLVVAAILFCIGLYGAMTRRNAIGILMCLELMLIGACLNLIAFGAKWGPVFTYQAFRAQEDISTHVGQIFILFVITFAACNVALGLALMIAMYRHHKSIDVDNINLLKW